MILATNRPVYITKIQCDVCGARTKFNHLDAKLCSACASFYRRAVREQLNYVCDGNMRCQIGRGRGACRRCRFAKCEEAGAHLLPFSPPLPTTQKPLPIMTTTTPLYPQSKTPTSYPILFRLLDGYESFLLSQKHLVQMIHPELRFLEDTIVSKRKIEHFIVNVKSIPLIMKLFCEFFGPFNELGDKEKQLIMAKVLAEFEVLRLIYLTIQNFPEQNDSRLMDTLCTYFDINPKFCAYYYEGFIEPTELPIYLNFLDYPFKKVLNHVDKFRRANLRKIDCVALMFLCLYKKADQLNLLTPKMSEYRDELLNELNPNVCKEYGVIEGPQRMTTLFYLLYESDNIALKIKDYVLLSQITLNKSRDELLSVLTNSLGQIKLDDCK